VFPLCGNTRHADDGADRRDARAAMASRLRRRRARSARKRTRSLDDMATVRFAALYGLDSNTAPRSVKCHKPTRAPQQRPALFDHFVDDRVYPWRYPDALAPKQTREASGRSGNPSRQVRMFRDLLLIAELSDSKAESDDVGLERVGSDVLSDRAGFPVC
jgi:hypothetical protein